MFNTTTPELVFPNVNTHLTFCHAVHIACNLRSTKLEMIHLNDVFGTSMLTWATN
jgi:hypothetical protein